MEGDKPVSDNDWESIKNGGDASIKRWVNKQLAGKSCTIVLIGSQTANREWIKYEIEKSWNDGKGLLGIYIHRLKDQNENQTSKGENPFSDFTVGDFFLSDIVKAYDPPYQDSSYVYGHIKDNLAQWVEEAIKIRK